VTPADPPARQAGSDGEKYLSRPSLGAVRRSKGPVVGRLVRCGAAVGTIRFWRFR
jgi:hypothetical protein